MNKARSPYARFLTWFIQSFNPKATLPAFITGWVVWIAVILGMSAEEGAKESLQYWVLQAFGKNWNQAFWWSAGAVALATMALSIRNKGSFAAVLPSVAIYTAPCALTMLGFNALEMIYAPHPAITNLWQMMGFMLAFFYLLGLGYFRLKLRLGREETIPAFLLPPFIVALALVGLAGFQLLTSVEYLYRNAFSLTVNSVTQKDGVVEISGTLNVHKAGPYEYQAFINTFDSPVESEQATKLVWDNEKDARTRLGDHAFHIRYPSTAKPIPSQLPDYEAPGGPEAYLQVNLPADSDRKQPVMVTCLPVSIWDFMPTP